jgi:signal transduction histidine kinase
MKCIDNSIVFSDELNGIYILANERFTTLQSPDAKNRIIINMTGGLPNTQFLFQDTFFMTESRRTLEAGLPSIIILPLDSNKLYVISDRIVLLDLIRHQKQIIREGRTAGDNFVLLKGQLLWIDIHDKMHRLRPGTKIFEPVTLLDQTGNAWEGSFAGSNMFSQFPFEDAFINAGQLLYKLIPTSDLHQYVIQKLLNEVPENCKINAVAYRKEEEVLVLGTDARGLFVYQPKYLNTFIYEHPPDAITNTYYAQSLIDSTTVLTGNRLLIDVGTHEVKEIFPVHFNPLLLCTDEKGNLFFARGLMLYRYNPRTKQSFQIGTDVQFGLHAITRIDTTIWIGTTVGIGYLQQDSVHWVQRTIDRGERYGIKSMTIDSKGDIWFGSYFQLYRHSRETGHLDSFPLFRNADCRTLAIVDGKLFIGTYGKGYFVYDHGEFIRMPVGRNDELSNVHAFIEDENQYLWITTNRGLYKTHINAVNAFIKDTAQTLDYYTYQEEDGIRSTEFNGGCSPSYLWLPDKLLSLPTIEGLVMFKPSQTPQFFPKDTLVFDAIEIDGKTTRPGHTIKIPANHSNVTVHFAGAWWSRSYNQYVSYKLEGLHSQYQLCAIDQASYAMGHLKTGKYTLWVKRRCGLGAEDFVYSKLHFIVETPWYGKTWAYFMYASVFLLLLWGTSVLKTRSIHQRNIALKKHVAIQTAKLVSSNLQLEDNLQKLADSERNLRKNIRIRDRLISIITHDILTPLRFIGQIARLGCEDNPGEDGMAKRALTDVQNAVHKLFHSTQNILHWVTYQQDHFKISSTNCSPFALVEQLMEDFREMSRFQGNILLNEVPEDDVILTDPRILNIVLHNLLSNAIKYTKNGYVHVRSRVVGRWYLLEVSDSGRGMTPVQLEAIRQGTSRQGEISVEDITAGTGIGLSLVADLMHALRGRWEIDSPEDIGVRVRIFISLDQQAPT